MGAVRFRRRRERGGLRRPSSQSELPISRPAGASRLPLSSSERVIAAVDSGRRHLKTGVVQASCRSDSPLRILDRGPLGARRPSDNSTKGEAVCFHGFRAEYFAQEISSSRCEGRTESATPVTDRPAFHSRSPFVRPSLTSRSRETDRVSVPVHPAFNSHVQIGRAVPAFHSRSVLTSRIQFPRFDAVPL